MPRQPRTDPRHRPTTRLGAPTGSQPARRSGSSQDSKAPARDDDKVATKPQDEASIDEIQTEANVAGCKAGPDAKAIRCAADGDSAEPAKNEKAAENKETDSLTPSSRVESAETNIGADAIAAVPMPAPDSGQHRHVAQLPEQAAPAAQFATQLKPLDPELLKEVVGRQANVGKQSEASKKAAGTEQIETDQVSDEPVDAPDLALESSAPAHVSGKPQPSTGDSDAQRIVQARGELPVSDHSHNDVPSTPTDNLVPQKGSVDASTPLIGSTQAHAASSAARSAALVAQPDSQPTAVPIGGVAIEIAGKALAGKNRFEIRLDPPELGRIEVRLDVDRDGNVTSRLTVERADTLDLLRRDAAGLERALQDAGLKTANNGLQFSLRDQSLNQQPGSGSSDAAQLVVQDETQIDLIPQNYGRLAGSGGGLDILV